MELVLERARRRTTEKALLRLFKKCDADGDGVLDFEEFCILLRHIEPDIDTRAALVLFNESVDVSNSYAHIKHAVDKERSVELERRSSQAGTVSEQPSLAASDHRGPGAAGSGSVAATESVAESADGGVGAGGSHVDLLSVSTSVLSEAYSGGGGGGSGLVGEEGSMADDEEERRLANKLGVKASMIAEVEHVYREMLKDPKFLALGPAADGDQDGDAREDKEDKEDKGEDESSDEDPPSAGGSTGGEGGDADDSDEQVPMPSPPRMDEDGGDGRDGDDDEEDDEDNDAISPEMYVLVMLLHGYRYLSHTGSWTIDPRAAEATATDEGVRSGAL